MRIVYLHQYFNTREMVGGTRSYEMARRLVDMGHTVDMITTRRDSSVGEWAITDEGGIRVHWLGVPYSNKMSHAARIRAFGKFAWASGRRAASVKADVVFATSTPLTIALPGVYAAKQLGVPMVFEVRDLWPKVPIAMGALRDPASIAAARWLERFAYRNSERIIALSEGMKEGVVEAGYPAERVQVIPNSSDLDLFDVGAEPGKALRARYPWLGDRKLVVYTGTLGALNGVEYFARLAARVRALDPDVRFAVIGEGKEEDAVRALAGHLGVLDTTFFMMGSVPKAEMPAWLSAADIATSLVVDIEAAWANSANKVFDAFASGTPLMINHEGWQADLLRETGAGLVLDVNDVFASAARVSQALRDPRWLAQAGEASHRLARERFDRDLLARDLESVLRDAVGAARPRAAATAPAPAREMTVAGSGVPHAS